MSNIITKHPAILLSEEIQTICRPLSKLNISYFAHVRVSHDGKFSGISNNPGFSEHYLKNKYYNADIHLAEKQILEKYIIWDLIERTGLSKKMHTEASLFGVQHTFTIISKSHQYDDFYHFASNVSTPAFNQTYIENIDLLKSFIAFFNETISSCTILAKAYNLQFSIDKSAPGYTIKPNEYVLNNQTNRHEFLRELNRLSDLYSIKSNPIPLLPPQQYRCVQLLAAGHSAKQIAALLNLSKRTVENYLAHVKKILRCHNSKELIAMYYSLELNN